jgi:hypothetical protein
MKRQGRITFPVTKRFYEGEYYNEIIIRLYKIMDPHSGSR